MPPCRIVWVSTPGQSGCLFGTGTQRKRGTPCGVPRLPSDEYLLLNFCCFAVRQSAAGFINRSGINSSVPYLYERNLSIDVYNIGDTIRHAIRAQDAVGFRGGTIFEIAEDGE